MPELLATVDKWFLVLAIIFLGAYFLWSVKNLFKGLMEAISELKELIRELFEDRNSHEKRIVRLETRCIMKHGMHSIEEEQLYQKKLKLK